LILLVFLIIFLFTFWFFKFLVWFRLIHVDLFLVNLSFDILTSEILLYERNFCILYFLRTFDRIGLRKLSGLFISRNNRFSSNSFSLWIRIFYLSDRFLRHSHNSFGLIRILRSHLTGVSLKIPNGSHLIDRPSLHFWHICTGIHLHILRHLLRPVYCLLTRIGL